MAKGLSIVTHLVIQQGTKLSSQQLSVGLHLHHSLGVGSLRLLARGELFLQRRQGSRFVGAVVEESLRGLGDTLHPRGNRLLLLDLLFRRSDGRLCCLNPSLSLYSLIIDGADLGIVSC